MPLLFDPKPSDQDVTFDHGKLLNPPALPSYAGKLREELHKYMMANPPAAVVVPDPIGATFKPKKDVMTTRPSAEEMIGMRLRFVENSSMPFRHLSAYWNDNVACVMVVTNSGKPVMLEDDPGLFPSDTLITQLKMIIETGDVK